MAASLKHVNCPPETWTELSSGFQNVQVRLSGPSQAGYLSLGSTAPNYIPDDDDDVIYISTTTPESFVFGGADTKMFFYPDTSKGRTVKLKVILE